MSLDYSQLVMILGTLFCVLGILLCIHTARTRFGMGEDEGRPSSYRLSRRPSTWRIWTDRVKAWLGIATLSAESKEKITAFAALIVLPAAAVFIANYHTFEGVHEVSGCASCHVMQPMVTDMKDPSSGTLAARHFKNRWIAKDQCFHCHSDYGFNGNLEAKMTGYRHLARYTTRTFHEPIRARVRFDNKNCLNCHENTAKFRAVQSHRTADEKLKANRMICLNCHGQAHPTEAQRTPGSADYARLMENVQ